MSMNPYEPVDPRPNTVEVSESSEILHDGFVQEVVEGGDGEKTTITTMEVPTEKETSVANRDFSEDLKLYMAKYPAYQHMLGMEVPIRSYMWNFFGAIVNTYLCEEDLIKPYREKSYSEMTVSSCLGRIFDMSAVMLNSVKHEEDDSSFLAEGLLNIAIRTAWAYLKLMDYEDKFVVPTPPEEKDVVEEIVERIEQ